MRVPSTIECPDELQSILASLNISLDLITARSLVLQLEPCELTVAEVDESGREHHLIPTAAKAWAAMKAAAATDGVSLRIVSAFRTVDRQAEIVRSKLQKGLSLTDVLCVSAPPGFSEHHNGRAVDVATEGSQTLEQEFEQTAAFAWLMSNAARFSFHLSFPPNNRFGYLYEPWHWCFRQPES